MLKRHTLLQSANVNRCIPTEESCEGRQLAPDARLPSAVGEHADWWSH